MRVISEAVRRDITRCVLPWHGNHPVLVRIERSQFLPIFSTPEKLRTAMAEAKITDYTIKQIEDGVDFLLSIAQQGIPVCLDLHRVNGKVRFHRVVLD